MGKTIKLDKDFKPDPEALSIGFKESDIKCKHLRLQIDEDALTVKCLTCDNYIDAFTFLKTMAFEERSQKWELEHLKREIKWMLEEKAKLQTDIKNLKAQKRRQE